MERKRWTQKICILTTVLQDPQNMLFLLPMCTCMKDSDEYDLFANKFRIGIPDDSIVSCLSRSSANISLVVGRGLPHSGPQ